jgi:hypothetical protein
VDIHCLPHARVDTLAAWLRPDRCHAPTAEVRHLGVNRHPRLLRPLQRTPSDAWAAITAPRRTHPPYRRPERHNRPETLWARGGRRAHRIGHMRAMPSEPLGSRPGRVVVGARLAILLGLEFFVREQGGRERRRDVRRRIGRASLGACARCAHGAGGQRSCDLHRGCGHSDSWMNGSRAAPCGAPAGLRWCHDW